MENSEQREKEIVKKTLFYYNNPSNNNLPTRVEPRKPVRRPLWVYVVGVVVVLAIINFFVGSQIFLVFSGGFLVGMLAMYIAMRLYKHK
jgi:hypothetical protein